MQSTDSFAELFAKASLSRKITLDEQYEIMSAVVEERLDEEEIVVVDRLIHALCQGRLQLVSEVD